MSDFTNIANLLSDQSIPPNIIRWLAKMKLMNGIPFNYLVPDEKYLPMESIKFFHVDEDWQNALLDGALSIGRHYTGTPTTSPSILTDFSHKTTVHQQARGAADSIRQQQLKQAQNIIDEFDPKEYEGMSGFLLRSKVVSGWKSMDVMAYPKNNSPYDVEQGHTNTVKPLPILRLERLSTDLLLGLFRGSVYELVLHQPPEAIHFGFQTIDPKQNQVTKVLREPTSDWDDENTSYTADSDHPATLDGVFYDSDSRVIDMMALSQKLGQSLSKKPGYYKNPASKSGKDTYLDHLVSSDFGLEMVKGVGLVSFINDAPGS